jgi:hypothetical protein
MVLLNLFGGSPAPALLRLPSGSFTLDAAGNVLVATVPSSFPKELLREIGREVLAVFREAAATQLPLAELIIDYSSLKMTARELRGGAIVFLAPKTAFGQTETQAGR